MQDREPTYPGRVTLTPVYGLANTYDMERADRPLQEGTPLNKANLLKDATAALYGLGSDAVPDDALHLLARFQSGLGNEYIWAKSQYQEIKTSSFLQFQGTQTSSILCSNQITIDSSGNILLSNPETYTFLQIQNNGSILKGKYVFYHPDSTHGDDRIKYVDETAQINFSSAGGSFFINVTSGGYIVSSQLEVVSYVNSPSPDAYPPAVSDGYTYTLHGQLGDKVRIATGSYTGTGTYGSSHPNTLTFAFEPKVFAIYKADNYANHIFIVPVSESLTSLYTTTPSMSAVNSTYMILSQFFHDSKTLKWYSTDNFEYQCNRSGTIYSYIAIG